MRGPAWFLTSVFLSRGVFVGAVATNTTTTRYSSQGDAALLPSALLKEEETATSPSVEENAAANGKRPDRAANADGTQSSSLTFPSPLSYSPSIPADISSLPAASPRRNGMIFVRHENVLTAVQPKDDATLPEPRLAASSSSSVSSTTPHAGEQAPSESGSTMLLHPLPPRERSVHPHRENDDRQGFQTHLDRRPPEDEACVPWDDSVTHGRSKLLPEISMPPLARFWPGSYHSGEFRRAILLPNCMKVQLISVVKSSVEKLPASAGVHINFPVGYSSDPAEIPGLAHLAEHILLGASSEESSATDVDALNSIVLEKSGYTSLRESGFSFETDVKYFRMALKNFVERFVSPRVTAAAIQREIRVIQSEFVQNSVNDTMIFDRILMDVADDSHPARHKHGGNAETLISEVGLEEDVEKFIKTKYSAKDAVAVIIAPHGLDYLQYLSEKYLTRFPTLDVSQPHKGIIAYPSASLPFSVCTAPTTTAPAMQFVWPIHLGDTKTMRHIEMLSPWAYIPLGNRDDFSVLGELTSRGLAFDASFGVSRHSDLHLARLVIQLTPKGVRDTHQVAKVVFGWIGQIQRDGGVSLRHVEAIQRSRNFSWHVDRHIDLKGDILEGSTSPARLAMASAEAMRRIDSKFWFAATEGIGALQRKLTHHEKLDVSLLKKRLYLDGLGTYPRYGGSGKAPEDLTAYDVGPEVVDAVGACLGLLNPENVILFKMLDDCDKEEERKAHGTTEFDEKDYRALWKVEPVFGKRYFKRPLYRDEIEDWSAASSVLETLASTFASIREKWNKRQAAATADDARDMNKDHAAEDGDASRSDANSGDDGGNGNNDDDDSKQLDVGAKKRDRHLCDRPADDAENALVISARPFNSWAPYVGERRVARGTSYDIARRWYVKLWNRGTHAPYLDAVETQDSTYGRILVSLDSDQFPKSSDTNDYMYEVMTDILRDMCTRSSLYWAHAVGYSCDATKLQAKSLDFQMSGYASNVTDYAYQVLEAFDELPEVPDALLIYHMHNVEHKTYSATHLTPAEQAVKNLNVAMDDTEPSDWTRTRRATGTSPRDVTPFKMRRFIHDILATIHQRPLQGTSWFQRLSRRIFPSFFRATGAITMEVNAPSDRLKQFVEKVTTKFNIQDVGGTLTKQNRNLFPYFVAQSGEIPRLRVSSPRKGDLSYAICVRLQFAFEKTKTFLKARAILTGLSEVVSSEFVKRMRSERRTGHVIQMVTRLSPRKRSDYMSFDFIVQSNDHKPDQLFDEVEDFLHAFGREKLPSLPLRLFMPLKIGGDHPPSAVVRPVTDSKSLADFWGHFINPGGRGRRVCVSEVWPHGHVFAKSMSSGRTGTYHSTPVDLRQKELVRVKPIVT